MVCRRSQSQKSGPKARSCWHNCHPFFWYRWSMCFMAQRRIMVPSATCGLSEFSYSPCLPTGHPLLQGDYHCNCICWKWRNVCNTSFNLLTNRTPFAARWLLLLFLFSPRVKRVESGETFAISFTLLANRTPFAARWIYFDYLTIWPLLTNRTPFAARWTWVVGMSFPRILRTILDTSWLLQFWSLVLSLPVQSGGETKPNMFAGNDGAVCFKLIFRSTNDLE